MEGRFASTYGEKDTSHLALPRLEYRGPLATTLQPERQRREGISGNGITGPRGGTPPYSLCVGSCGDCRGVAGKAPAELIIRWSLVRVQPAPQMKVQVDGPMIKRGMGGCESVDYSGLWRASRW